MKNQISVLLASVLVVVALSGCIGQEAGRGAATGVIIKSFGPDMSEVFSSDPVTFTLSVENVGGEDATDVEAKLFGLGTDWTGDDWVNIGSRTKYIGFLERSQPEYKAPGGFGDAQWDVEAPVGLKVDNTYSAGVRLYYGYSTTALANIKIYSNDYLRSNPEEAEKIMKSSGIESFTVTDAPITIELAGLARPLIYRGSGQTASITALLSNMGQGKPYDDEENDMEVTVTGFKVNNVNCVEDAADIYRLPRAGKKSVPCRFNIPSVDSYTTIPVEITLSYNYFIDDTSSIKVLKSIDIGITPTTTSPGPTPVLP